MVQAFYLDFLLVKFSLKFLRERKKTEYKSIVMTDMFSVIIKNTQPKAPSLYNIGPTYSLRKTDVLRPHLEIT